MTATNEKLSESEIRYKFLIDSIPDVMGELDLDGTISFVSPQVYDLLGYHPDEMVGTDFFKFIHHDDVPGVTKAMKKAIKSKEVILPKLRLKHKKGIYILVFAKGKLIKLDDKTRLIGVIRDITKLIETEKKLEESQDNFEQLNEVFLKFKEDPIFNLQLLINAAGLILNADCALFNVLKKVNGKEVLESLVIYNEPPDFTRESDPKGHICTDIIKDNPDDVVILSDLDKTDYIKTDENVRKYNLKQYVSYVVRFNNKPIATFCVVYTENREMSNNYITILKILSKSASTELARWNSQIVSQKSEEKYVRLINNLTDIILELNIKGIVTYVSPQCYNIMGYQPAEIIGKNVMGFIHPDDILLIAEAMKQVIKTNEILTFRSYRIIHKNGDSIYVSAKGRYVNEGGSEKFIGVIRDEREHMIAETKLKESEEKYRNLVEDAQEGVWALDERENTTFVNPRICEMLGYTKNEMMGKNLYSLIPDSMKEQIKGNRKRREKGLKETYDLELIKKDGTIIYTNIKAAPVMSESREYKGSFAYITDITTQKQAEDTLRESEQKYRSLAHELETILDHLPLIIAHKDDKNTLLRVNKYYADAHNLKKEDMEGKSAFDFYPHDQAQVYLDDDLEVIKSGKPKLNYIEPWESKNGSRWVNTSKIPYIDEEGNIKGIIAIVNDITEKKEIEEMKTYLLTRFSHEFKTPLVSIKGFSDLLLTEYKDKLDEKMVSFLKKIKEGGDKLILLVNTFIQSSQLGEKLTRLKIDKENLSDLIKLGVSEMQGLIHLRKHTIKVDIPDKIIGEFDKEQIYSVITNLLLNAIKYTPPGGKIFIHSKIEEGNIFFSIKDNGIGLTEEDKRYLFQSLGKIERYGNGWDIVTEGMGVGLYLSKEMISLHGGKIWAESEGKNKGSTFFFSLPMTNF